MIDDPVVIAQLCRDVYDSHATMHIRLLNPSRDPSIQRAIEQSVKDSQNRFASEQASKAELALKACINAASMMSEGELAEGLLNLRDRVAHSVTETFREMYGRSSRAKYGQEREVLKKTIAIIEDLYCWVNGTSFDIGGDCFEIARKRAKDFWCNLVFSREKQV